MIIGSSRNCLVAKSSKTVHCRGHLCKPGGSEHIVPFFTLCISPNIHLSALQRWSTFMAADCIIQEQFLPNFIVLILLHRIPIYRLDAHRYRNLFDGIKFARQVCAICSFL